MGIEKTKGGEPGALGVRSQEAFKEPLLYKVILHDDDFTPKEFVVAALEVFFHMERAIATKVVHEICKTGMAICGIYSKDIALTKVDKVTEHARRHEFPLLCSVEVT